MNLSVVVNNPTVAVGISLYSKGFVLYHVAQRLFANPKMFLSLLAFSAVRSKPGSFQPVLDQRKLECEHVTRSSSQFPASC